MYKTTELNGDWLVIEEYGTVKESKRVLIQVREPTSERGRLGRVIEEFEDVREIKREEPTGFIAIMTARQYNLMQANYERGGCSVGIKGYMRYSNAHKMPGGGWYGQPGQTARKLVRGGIACPKQIDSLFHYISDEC